MADYININGKEYRVASNVMGVTLGFLSAKNGVVPEDITVEDWALLLTLSIFWGEHLDGRESDFNLDEFCAMNAQEGVRVMKEFQHIYAEQHGGSEAPKKD